MKTAILVGLIVVAVCGSGCMGTGARKLVAALAKDPATVHVRISTVYGVLEFSRTNPSTNTLPHTVSPDGTISVEKSK